MKLINGIAFEGVNCVGKSTVIGHVASMLSEWGNTTERRKCMVAAPPAAQSIHDLAFETLPMHTPTSSNKYEYFREFNILRSAEAMLDAEAANFCLPTSSMILQDRHWFSQVLNNRVLGGESSLLSDEWMASRAPQYRLSVLLTCDQNERARRSYSRGQASHRLNEYLERCPDVAEELQSLAIGLADRLHHPLVIDTTDLDAIEVAMEIFETWKTEWGGNYAN